MRLPRFALVGLAGAFASTALCVEPAQLVREALLDFIHQSSYTWENDYTQDKRTNKAVGQHENGGYTKLEMTDGPHIPLSVRPVTESWPAFSNRDEETSTQWVFWTPKAWRRLSELPPAESSLALSENSHATPGRSGGGRMFGVRRPDHVVAIVFENLEGITQLSPDNFSATIKPAGATELLPFKPSRSAGGPVMERAAGQIEIRLREGQLEYYRIGCEGTIRFGPAQTRLPRTITMTCRVSDLGTTVIEVPDEVRRLLKDKKARK